jgi:transposase InsO family protein
MECQKFQFRKPLYQFSGQSAVSGIFQDFAIDFLGPFPPTVEGYRYIIVAVEKLSRYPIAKATKDQVATTAVDFVQNEIIAHFGCPKVITVDRGSCFISSIFQKLAADYMIQLNFTPGY